MHPLLWDNGQRSLRHGRRRWLASLSVVGIASATLIIFSVFSWSILAGMSWNRLRRQEVDPKNELTTHGLDRGRRSTTVLRSISSHNENSVSSTSTSRNMTTDENNSNKSEVLVAATSTVQYETSRKDIDTSSFDVLYALGTPLASKQSENNVAHERRSEDEPPSDMEKDDSYSFLYHLQREFEASNLTEIMSTTTTIPSRSIDMLRHVTYPPYYISAKNATKTEEYNFTITTDSSLGTSNDTQDINHDSTDDWNATKNNDSDNDYFLSTTERKMTFHIRPIYMQGLPYKQSNATTRVFAWLSTPIGLSNNETNQVPGVVLVHGGGGTAFREWCEVWAQRGYASISIATEGQTDVSRTSEDRSSNRTSTSSSEEFLPPIRSFPYEQVQPSDMAGPYRPLVAYSDFISPLDKQWMFHAVADTLLATHLLRNEPTVHPNLVGLQGVSWGGVIVNTAIGFLSLSSINKNDVDNNKDVSYYDNTQNETRNDSNNTDDTTVLGRDLFQVLYENGVSSNTNTSTITSNITSDENERDITVPETTSFNQGHGYGHHNTSENAIASQPVQNKTDACSSGADGALSTSLSRPLVAFAIMGYGCGSLGDSLGAIGRQLRRDGNEGASLYYKQVWDPVLRLNTSRHIPQLYISSPEDIHFPLIDQATTYNSVLLKHGQNKSVSATDCRPPVQVVNIPNLTHGHPQIFTRQESYQFAKSVVEGITLSQTSTPNKLSNHSAITSYADDDYFCSNNLLWAYQVDETIFTIREHDDDAARSQSTATATSDDHDEEHYSDDNDHHSDEAYNNSLSNSTILPNQDQQMHHKMFYRVTMNSLVQFTRVTLVSSTDSTTIETGQRRWTLTNLPISLLDDQDENEHSNSTIAVSNNSNSSIVHSSSSSDAQRSAATTNTTIKERFRYLDTSTVVQHDCFSNDHETPSYHQKNNTRCLWTATVALPNNTTSWYVHFCFDKYDVDKANGDALSRPPRPPPKKNSHELCISSSFHQL